MARDKKSFLLYCDLIHTVKKMPKEKAGELFIHILEYVNDKNPETDDLIINLTFEPIKQQLKRDLSKYEQIRKRNSENARKRWDATACENKQTNTKNADNDNVNDTDNVNDKEKKRKKKFTPPTPLEITNYGKENGYNIDGNKISKFYLSEDGKNWIDSKGKKVINWKQKVLSVWCKEENKIKENIIIDPMAERIRRTAEKIRRENEGK